MVWCQKNNTKHVNSVSQNKFDRKNWQQLIKPLQYNEREEKESKTDLEKPKFRLPDFDVKAGILSYFLYGVIILVLIVVLYFLLKNIDLSKVLKQKSVELKIEEKLNKHVQSLDLEKILKEALKNKLYKLAVRIYYLMVIKELAVQKLINWKKDKTNSDYLSELYNHSYYSTLNNLTTLFERAWYSERIVDDNSFVILEKQFKEGLQKLISSNVLPNK